jgi:putative FmdB family regulatory protein
MKGADGTSSSALPMHGRAGAERARNEKEKEGQPMPLYEYACQQCGQLFEIFTQRREPATPPSCPACGKAGVKRILSSFSGKVSDAGGCGTGSGLG